MLFHLINPAHRFDALVLSCRLLLDLLWALGGHLGSSIGLSSYYKLCFYFHISSQVFAHFFLFFLLMIPA